MSEILVKIKYSGTEEGAEKIQGLIEKLRAIDGAQEDASRSSQEMVEASRQGTAAAAAQSSGMSSLVAVLREQHQGWGVLAGAISQAGSVLSRVNPELGRIGGAFGQVAQNIQTLIPALISRNPLAITGAVISTVETIADLVSAFDQMADAARARAAETAQALRRVAASADAAKRAADALSESLRASRVLSATSDAGLEREAAQLDQSISDARDNDLARINATIDALRTRARNEEESLVRLGRLQDRLTFRQVAARRARIESDRDRAIALIHEVERERTATESRITTMLDRQTRIREQQLRLASEDRAGDEAEAARNEAFDRSLGGGGGGGSRQQTLMEMEAAAFAELSANRQLMDQISAEADQARLAALDEEKARRRAIADLRFAQLDREKEGQRALLELAESQLDKQKEGMRLQEQQSAAIAQTIGGYAQQLGAMVNGAFQSMVSGQKTAEEAAIGLGKTVLQVVGAEAVARGLMLTIQGFAEIPSPTAPLKIGGGLALVALGVGLGAAGAAIPTPSSGSAPAQPSGQSSGDGGGEGPSVINVVFGGAMVTAATNAQLARGLKRQLSGDRSFSAGTA